MRRGAIQRQHPTQSSTTDHLVPGVVAQRPENFSFPGIVGRPGLVCFAPAITQITLFRCLKLAPRLAEGCTALKISSRGRKPRVPTLLVGK